MVPLEPAPRVAVATPRRKNVHSAFMFVAGRTREARRRIAHFAVGRLLGPEGLLPLFLECVDNARLFSAAQASKQWASIACVESPLRLEALEAALVATLTEPSHRLWRRCDCVVVESTLTEQIAAVSRSRSRASSRCG